MDYINNDIPKLLPLYFENRLDAEQTSEVESWIEASDDNRAIADNMAKIYQASDTLHAIKNADSNSALKSINSRIRRMHIHTIFIKMQRVAAMLFIPLLMVSLLQLYYSLRPQPLQITSLSTNPGMTASATLPDGTKVNLNSDSRLSYPTTFVGDERKVNLQGEAYFNVAKDSRHPFIVSTPQQADIKVYGTHFDVEAYPSDDRMTATLEEGIIAMKYTDRNNCRMEQLIEPGEAIVYSMTDKNIQVSKTEVDVATSWKDGRLIFRSTPMRGVLRSLSKRFGVQFDVRNPKIYVNSITGTLERQRLDRIMEYLTLTSGLHFKYAPNANLNNEKQIIIIY
jgi:ferric-dicitrate binding protein FerR (iron transport regulator)